MNEIKLSIVIPMYNAQKFIARCLESVSDLSIKSMECILINDGSTDGTIDICEHYLKKDPRFRLITINNSGVSEARNIGVKETRGKYLFFLDADDYLSESGYDNLIEAVEADYDFFAFSYFTLYENNTVCEEMFDFSSKCSTDLNKAYELLLASPKLNTCWGKLLKTDIVLQNEIMFPSNMKTGEDAVFIINYMRYIKSCCLENNSVLYYRQHLSSAMRTVDINKKLLDLEILYNTRIKFLKELNLWKFEANVYRELFSVITNLLLEMTLIYSYKDMKEKYRLIIEDQMSTDIMRRISKQRLTPAFKRIEYLLINYKAYNLLLFYFKLKQLFK